MDFPTSFLYNPQYFDVIVRATGLLSGNQRFERIKEVASKNIWLAARCKNTCVSEEQEIVDWLIIRSSLLYNRFNDIQAIIALMELKEWGVILSFFGSPKKIPIQKWGDNMVSTSIPTAFAVLSDYLPYDIVHRLFVRLPELGYSMNLASYNAYFQAVKNTTEADSILKEMSQQGVTPDMKTYCLLLEKESDENRRNIFCSLLRQTINWDDDFQTSQWAYSLLITNCKTHENVLREFDEFLKHCPETKADLVLLSRIYAKIISTAPTLSDAEEQFTHFYQVVQDISKMGKVVLRPKKFKRYTEPLLALMCRIPLNDEESNRLLILAEELLLSGKYNNTLRPVLIKRKANIIDHKVKYDLSVERLLRILELFKPYFGGENSSHSRFSAYYLDLLLKSNTEEDCFLILKHLPSKNISPKDISNILKQAHASQRINILHAVCKCGFEINIIHYNIVIKDSTYEEGFLLVNEMIERNINPDKYTIQALMKKWSTIEELLDMIHLASYFGIVCDDRCNKTLYFRCKEIGVQKDIMKAIHENRFDGTSISWIQPLKKYARTNNPTSSLPSTATRTPPSSAWPTSAW